MDGRENAPKKKMDPIVSCMYFFHVGVCDVRRHTRRLLLARHRCALSRMNTIRGPASTSNHSTVDPGVTTPCGLVERLGQSQPAHDTNLRNRLRKEASPAHDHIAVYRSHLPTLVRCRHLHLDRTRASPSICRNLLDHEHLHPMVCPLEGRLEGPFALRHRPGSSNARSMVAALQRLATCRYDTSHATTVTRNGDRPSIRGDDDPRATRGRLIQGPSAPSTVDHGLRSYPYSRG